MPEQSGFRAVIDLLNKIGVYDVILPFLLVFTIIFAILEKTKILGVEKIGGEAVGKKNLNAMVAVGIAFLVVASTKLVAVINSALANIVLLILLGVSFLLMVGVFFKSEELDFEKFPTYLKIFMVIMFIGVIVIFLNALDWLQPIFDLFKDTNKELLMNILFFVITIAFIAWITYTPNKPK